MWPGNLCPPNSPNKPQHMDDDTGGMEHSAQPIIPNLPIWQGFICLSRPDCQTWTRNMEVGSFLIQHTYPAQSLHDIFLETTAPSCMQTSYAQRSIVFHIKPPKVKNLKVGRKPHINLPLHWKRAQNENTRKTRSRSRCTQTVSKTDFGTESTVDAPRLDSILWQGARSDIRARQLATFKVEWLCIWCDSGWQLRRAGID